MPTLYKIEIFSRDYVFQDWSTIPNPTITFDYLTLDSSTVVVPKLLNAQRGQYICISNGYQGIIESVNYEDSTTTLTVVPLLSLLDVTAYYDRASLVGHTLENFLCGMIKSTYQDNVDTTQNIDGIEVIPQTGTEGADLNLDTNIVNIFSLAILALTKYGIIIDISVNPQQQKLSVLVRKVLSPTKTIESDLPNIIEKLFTLKDSYGSINKFVAVNQRDETESLVFFIDGYSPPPVWAMEYIDDDDFSGKAAARAAELFTPETFNNLIEITARSDDKIIYGLSIGDAVTIIKNNIAYPSVLTGYDIENNLIKWVFGAVRIDLTKILKIERRSK